jgi:hypothetical protein
MIVIEERTAETPGTPLRWLTGSVETSYVTPAEKGVGL